MSLAVPADLREQAQQGEVDDAAFLAASAPRCPTRGT